MSLPLPRTVAELNQWMSSRFCTLEGRTAYVEFPITGRIESDGRLAHLMGLQLPGTRGVPPEEFELMTIRRVYDTRGFVCKSEEVGCALVHLIMDRVPDWQLLLVRAWWSWEPNFLGHGEYPDGYGYIRSRFVFWHKSFSELIKDLPIKPEGAPPQVIE